MNCKGGQSCRPSHSSVALFREHTVNDTSASTRRVKVTIVYCASCGYEPYTLDLAKALMQTFLYDLASIELIPWEDGAFDVVVDGDLIHSMYRDGGFPEHETVIRAVRERLSQPV